MPAPWIRALLGSLAADQRLLLAVAAPAEAGAVAQGLRHPSGFTEGRPVELAPRLAVVRTGVGKAPAAATVAALLAQGGYGGVLNLGIAGALPAVPGPPPILTTVIATAHAFADEGVALPPSPGLPEPFLSLAELGFAPDAAPGMQVPGHAGWVGVLREGIPGAVAGVIATVSVCSGRDALAAAVVARTGAVAEAMEGAAVALAARRAGVAYGEVRVISNTTGDRDRQEWRVGPALAELARLVEGR